MFFNGFFLVVFCAIGKSNSFQDFWLDQKKIGVDPGPLVVPSQGEVWPKPQMKITTDKFFIVRPNVFQFKIVEYTCEILEKAIERYKHDMKAHDRIRRTIKMMSQNETRRRVLVNEETFKGYLDELSINLQTPCETSPYFNMDEHYELNVNREEFPGRAFLISFSIWGILRGLETWSQLIYSSSDHNALIINSTSIMDFPRFSHRGLLIDTSRHFLPMRTIYMMLDAMAMSKLNVLHWHIVDDQSFPFQSKTFPKLSTEGAFAPTHVYTPADVLSVISYATLRGIRVIPEFDTPGHTRSWGEGYPNLLTKCYKGGVPDGSLGPMNPISSETYDFMKKLLKEIKETFPDSYIHLGGDEVEFECWESNPEILEYMAKKNLSARHLEGNYINAIVEMATNLTAKSIVWQEVFDNGAKLPEETVVHVWKSNYVGELHDVTKKGYKTLLSSCWYLDSLNSGGDWKKFYGCDPLRFPGSNFQKRLIIGGEACMWGEVVDVNNIMSRVWPRACATAEKLWSTGEEDISEASKRLEEHTCRMNRRKIAAQPPNGPGFCPDANFT